jgi:hypothetical protein
MLSPKESHQPSKDSRPGKQTILWHWLYKHPVEFSKNNHTPTTTTTMAATGATPQLYPVRFVVSSAGLPALTLTVRSTQKRAPIFIGFASGTWQAVHCGAYAPHSVRFPAGRSHYPTFAPAPNRIAHPLETVARSGTSRGLRNAPPAWFASHNRRILISGSPAGREKITPTRSRPSNRRTLSYVTPSHNRPKWTTIDRTP